MSRPALYGLHGRVPRARRDREGGARPSTRAGYRKVDAYTPYPMEEVLDALHLHQTHVPKLVLAGGIFGLAGGLRPAVLDAR